MKGIWFTWEIQRRNIGISSALGWPLYQITYQGLRFKRYVYSTVKTLITIIRENPKVVAAQNPSIVLALIVVSMKCIFRYKVIIDAHNSGIYPMEGKNQAFMMVSRWLQRHADLTIVTNEQLKAVVESNGGQAFVLPDRLPDVSETGIFPMQGRINIAFICTYSADEPYMEVFQAAHSLPDDVVIYVTGKYKGKVDEKALPNNLRLLGFVPDDQFWSLLSSVDFILDLTLRENCLVCGAYEAVALTKPLILSDTKILKSYFFKGAEYVGPTSVEICEGIKRAISRQGELLHEIKMLKNDIELSWDHQFQLFKKRICYEWTT